MTLEGVNSRQLAFFALKEVHKQQAYTDIALDRVLRKHQVSDKDRALVCELVYGCVRRQRTLDFIIDQLGKKTAAQQPPDLRLILHLGLYQMRYLCSVPVSAAVNTTVELAKKNGLQSLAPVVNALLRKYERIEPQQDLFSSLIGGDQIKRLAILSSFPDWIVATWLEQLTTQQTQQLCEWFNQSPTMDLRVNVLRTTVSEVQTALAGEGINVAIIKDLPQGLRLSGSIGAVPKLPGFDRGWWMVQDSSAQLVSHLLDPQPGEVVIDACAAPGGKTTHLAELMRDEGEIWAGDRCESRLRKVKENAERLGIKSISLYDDKTKNDFREKADRVLVDAPCSGLGTLHKHPDIRWRQTPEGIEKLSKLQSEILQEAATWVKPGGVLVYATCTLSLQENEQVIEGFLATHHHWQIAPPPSDSLAAPFADSNGLIKVWPHLRDMDGFFMVKLHRGF